MQSTAPRAELHADAKRELDDAVAYFEADWEYQGILFLDSFNTAVERLLRYPLAGKARGRVRRWVMANWRYTLIYAVEPYGIFIIAIAHHSRRPNYWRERIR